MGLTEIPGGLGWGADDHVVAGAFQVEPEGRIATVRSHELDFGRSEGGSAAKFRGCLLKACQSDGIDFQLRDTLKIGRKVPQTAQALGHG